MANGVGGDRSAVRIVGLALLLTGCGTAMHATRLTPPVRSHEQGLGVHIAEVHVSWDVRTQDFSESSRVLVVLDLIAKADIRIDLRDSRLTLTGLEGSGDSQPQRALATGAGQAPAMLSDHEFIPPLELKAGVHRRAWVAFGELAPRAHRELPERVVLELPTGQRLTLSQPGSAPVWRGEAQTFSSGSALWLQGSADETSVNFAFADNRRVAGPVVIGYRFGIGFRSPIYKAQPSGDDVVCCNLAMAADVAWPMWLSQGAWIIAPFAGVEASLLTQHSNVSRPYWVGPSLGIELAAAMPPPRHGPFPIDYPHSLLGNMYLRAALIHWFGPDRDYPSFGYMLSVGSAFGN